MSATKGFYITTPIYYVNGLPHIGHAYTTIAADTATRWQRLLGRDAFFLTGTDEHGQKVLQKAVQRGMSPIEHCDDMVVHWKEVWKRLDVQYDHFLRTTDASHIEAVQAALIDLKEKGLLYTQQYEGWYSEAAERFWTEKDLVDGKCPDSGLPVVFLSEDNWFFKMSQFQGQLVAHIEAHPEFIQPASRRNEVLGFLRKPLGDLCISRPKSRMSWGIEIPFATDYVTYVWFDALLNYLTGIGWMPGGSRVHEQWWPADFQLVGKDILTTHAVYWSTMLMALEVPLPKTIYAHGWWVAADGQKMSKSLGNTIDVNLLADSYGVDAARYFFLREIAFGADGGFSYEIFLNRYNADLANDLGNLGHRGLSMTTNWLGGVVPALGELQDIDRELMATATAAVRGFVHAMDKLQFQDALASLFSAVGAANKYIDTTQPWTLNKNGDLARLATVKRCVLEVCAIAGTLLLPVMPTKAAELLAKLGISPNDHARFAQRLAFGDAAFDLLSEGSGVEVGDPLFPRFREQPEAIGAMLAEAARLHAAELEAEKAAKAAQKAAEKAAKAAKAAEPAPSKAELAAAPGETITYEDFAKVKLRMGQIIAAEKHPKADKLLVLKVDVGEETPRQIVAGIANKYAPDELVGRRVVVVVNLAPAKLRGVESQGMLLAAGGLEVVDLVSAHAPVGEPVR